VEFHGGNIFDFENEQLIDCSANINPLGIPLCFQEALLERMKEWTYYPDRKYRSLKKSIACYLGLENEEWILPSSGAMELISIAMEAYPFEKLLLFTPTFSEYERKAKQLKMPVERIPLSERDEFQPNLEKMIEKVEKDSLIILCNPNNPTGVLVSTKELLVWIEKVQHKGGYVLIDEAFIEFTDQYPRTSLIPAGLSLDHLLIVRAATKFFGMPGVRLGYGVTRNAQWRESIQQRMDPWHIHIGAVIAGEVIFHDKEYIQFSRQWIQKERLYCYKELQGISALKAYPSQGNFHWIRLLPSAQMDAWELQQKLLEDHILIRSPQGFYNTDSYFFRLAIKNHRENQYVLHFLQKKLENKKGES